VKVNLKKAPQREILEIERSGEWGKVDYRHRLTCGHVEIRKRPSSAPKIACSWCVVAEEKQQELQLLANPARSSARLPQAWTEEEAEVPYIDADGETDLESSKLRAGLVLALGCSPESVEVITEVDENGDLSARYVVVFMDIVVAKRLAKFDSDTPM
jgi:hypothetical protein